VNDLRLQYSYFSLATVNPCATCPQDITINDLLGGVTVGPGDNTFQKQNTYEIGDTFSWSHGKHTFKFGGGYTHFIYPQFFLPRSNSDNQYNSADAFINDVLPDNPGRTLRNAGTGSFLGTQSLFAIFAQDDFKVTLGSPSTWASVTNTGPIRWDRAPRPQRHFQRPRRHYVRQSQDG